MGFVDSGFELSKPTFEAVKQAQNGLRVLLLKLIDENRALNKKEQKQYFDLIAYSTLGLGTVTQFKIFNDRIYTMKNIECAARWLGIQTKNKISFPGELGSEDSDPIAIKLFWQRLLEYLFQIFPLALDKSISMSKEIEKRDSFRGALVE